MEQKNNLLRYKNILLPIIFKYLPKTKIILFGSRARGDYIEGADIDLALDNDTEIDQVTLMKIKNDIDDSRIPVWVDLVDLHGADTILREQIKKDGKTWTSSK